MVDLNNQAISLTIDNSCFFNLNEPVNNPYLGNDQMENISFKLPDYEVIIHIKENDFSKHLEREIALLTAAFDL